MRLQRVQSDICIPGIEGVYQKQAASAVEKGCTLANQKPDPDPRHVETVKPMLHVEVDVSCVLASFPFEYALGDGGDGGIMALLDSLEGFCERAIVLAHLWRPFRYV